MEHINLEMLKIAATLEQEAAELELISLAFPKITNEMHEILEDSELKPVSVNESGTT